MADTNKQPTDNHNLSKLLIRHTLASWRFILIMALIPLIWASFCQQQNIIRALIVAMAGILIYQSWRLWLDENYFAEISEHNNQQAGIILTFIWQKNRLQYLSLQQRYQGAIRQLKISLICCAVLWIIWLIALII